MNASNAWSDQWLKAQQQFVETWGQMAKGSSSDNSQTNLWSEGIKLWTDSLQPKDHGVQDALNKCFEAGKSYFTMAEQVGKLMSDGKTATDAMNQWAEQLKSSLQPGSSGQFNLAGQDFMKQWSAPGQNWEKLISNMGMFGQSPLQMPGINSGAFNLGEMTDPLGKMLSAPGVGYFREPQEKQQKGLQLMIEYHTANNAFNQASMRVMTESIQGFQDRLMNPAGESTPTSMRELYDLWVEVSEEHNAVFSMSDEYQALYGDMVNKLMSTKKHYQGITNDLFKTLNLPGRQEVDTVQLRLQEVRRENRRLRSQITDINAKLDILMSAKSAPEESAPIKKAPSKTKSKPVITKNPVARKKALAKKNAATQSGDKA
jgi:class III poly(R)-hydroxyalkanoic acid synthase PhaE subunit